MTNEDSTGKRIARHLAGWSIGLVVVVLVALSWTDHSTELTPNHADRSFTIGLWCAAVTAPVSLFLMLWLKLPMRGPRILAAPATALGCGIVTALWMSWAADRISEALDFSGKITRSEQQLPISRAYISHGRGSAHHIQLSGYAADLTVSPEDYARLFGQSDEVHPRDLCLKAPIERNGSAIRVMFRSTKAIPPGRIIRCAEDAAHR